MKCASTPDVEKIAREALNCLYLEVDKSIADDVKTKVLAWTKALAQARAPLIVELKHQRELWELAADQLNACDDTSGQVRFTQLHNPISAIDAALTGTEPL